MLVHFVMGWLETHIHTHKTSTSQNNSVDSHKHFRDKAKLPFQLLSDPKKEVARSFNNLRVSMCVCVAIKICVRREGDNFWRRACTSIYMCINVFVCVKYLHYKR